MIRFLARLEGALITANRWEYFFFTSLFTLAVVLMWWVVVTAPGLAAGVILAVCALFPTTVSVLCARAGYWRLRGG